jgi:hypothetical protein
MSEMIIPGIVCVPKGGKVKSFEGIIEPIEEKLETDNDTIIIPEKIKPIIPSARTLATTAFI